MTACSKLILTKMTLTTLTTLTTFMRAEISALIENHCPAVAS